MELIKRFRVDTLKLSTEDLPIAEADGTTCYEVDTMKLYIYYKGKWYLQEEATESKNTENNTKTIKEDTIIKESNIEEQKEEK